jgi:glutaredoxin
MKITLIKTEHCPKCKSLEPGWNEFQQEHPEIEFKVILFGSNPEDDKFVIENNIQTAPSIVIDNGEVKGLYSNVFSKSGLEYAYETFTKGKNDEK